MAVDFDVVVVGGGVVGCGVFRALALRGQKVALCERLPRVAGLASRGNSGMLHTGFDATPGTTEARLVKRGHELFWEWVRWRTAHGLATPCKMVGALLPVWTPQEMSRVKEIHDTATSLGVHTEIVEPKWLYQEEPNLRPGALGALHVPGETAVDPFLVPALYAAEASAAGGSLMLRCEVTRVTRSSGAWELTVRQAGKERKLRAAKVVNCGGLRGAEVENMRTGRQPEWEIRPRLGRYAVFGRGASSFVTRMLLPLPTKKTKGVILFPTVYGEIVIGPTAEEPGEREAHTTVMSKLRDAAVARVPVLADHDVAWDYAGSRPALAGRKDYWLEVAEGGDWVVVAGIRSTGLTAALGLGEEVAGVLGLGAPREPPLVGVSEVHSTADPMVHPISARGWPKTARL